MTAWRGCRSPLSIKTAMTVILPFVWLSMLMSAAACYSGSVEQRYRGDYTLGHEVNTFCPRISSQCYWLAPGTGQSVRARLSEIYHQRSPGLYKPVCMIVSGRIDRESPRSGFAADMDGLITVTGVYGDCDSSEIVTQGDLQHHRWVLETRNQKAVDERDWPVVPVLDFGDRMFVEGADGCRTFSGFAVLSDERIVFDSFTFGENQCLAGRDSRGLFSIAGAWVIRIDEAKSLVLEAPGTVLKFERDDWR